MYLQYCQLVEDFFFLGNPQPAEHYTLIIPSAPFPPKKMPLRCSPYRLVSKKHSYSVSLIERESASKCVYFVRSNTLLLGISLLCIYLLYPTDPQTHRLDCFLKFAELSGQVGISRIPSNKADRKITNLSGKHSFTQIVS